MDEKRLQTIADALDERLTIMRMPHASVADRTYYEGMIQMAYYFGYEVRRNDDGTHQLIKM